MRLFDDLIYDAKTQMLPNGYGYQGTTQLPSFSGKHQAADTRAWLTREEWKDYQNRFAPRERELVGAVSREGAIEELGQRLADIKVDNKNAYSSSRGMVDQMNQRYGVQPDAQMAGDQSRKSSLNQSLSAVDSINRTTESIANRNLNVIGGDGLTGRQLLNEG